MMRLFRKAISLLTACSLSAAMLAGCGLIEIRKIDNTSAPTAAPATAQTDATAATGPAKTGGALTPLLWKVEGEKGNVLYLFGTIHLGDKRNETVMQQVADKVDACDALAVECDVVAFEKDQERLTNVVQSLLYTDGTTVADHMKPGLYEKSKQFLTDSDAYIDYYDYYNLSFWSTLLQQTEINKSNLEFEKAMDTQLLNHAKEKKQEILEVESVEFQYDMENKFSDEWYNLQIDAFLETKDDLIPDTTALYEAWLAGDEAEITKMILEDEDGDLTAEEKKLLEEYHKAMYTDRNNGMAAKAEQYLNSGKSVFFAVGEAHMVGDEGIVKQLKDKGFRVEKISP